MIASQDALLHSCTLATWHQENDEAALADAIMDSVAIGTLHGRERTIRTRRETQKLDIS